jgi:hypothetical protein
MLDSSSSSSSEEEVPESRLVRSHKWCMKQSKELKKAVVFSELNFIMIEGYIDIVMSVFLQITSDQHQWYWVSILLGFICFILFSALIIWVSRQK